MSRYVAPTEADRLRRAESRWLEQARERLRGSARPSRRTDPPQTRTEETDRLRRAESRWLEQARERLRGSARPSRRTDPPQTRTEETDR